MTGKDIINKVSSYKDMKYWYGAKRQIATLDLANQLKKDNPGTWTDAYYNKAIKDIDGTTKVCDCSGMVCDCYSISDISSSQIYNKYPLWKGDVKPGLIAWKSGHVGIITDEEGHMAEMRGIDYDFMNTRTYKEAGMTALLYDPQIDYDYAYCTGWHNDAGKYWYAYDTSIGSYYRDEWKVIDGRWYYFGSDGYIKTGLFQDNKGDYYVGDDWGLYHEDPSKMNGSLIHWDVKEV